MGLGSVSVDGGAGGLSLPRFLVDFAAALAAAFWARRWCVGRLLVGGRHRIGVGGRWGDRAGPRPDP